MNVSARGRTWGRRSTHPKIKSGWDMKSVMRSSILRGSSTNVGNVTLWRSMPTLEASSAPCISHRRPHVEISAGAPELRDQGSDNRTLLLVPVVVVVSVVHVHRCALAMRSGDGKWTHKIEVSSGSVSSGILSSRELPRGRCSLDAVWLNRPIISVFVKVRAGSGEAGACIRICGG